MVPSLFIANTAAPPASSHVDRDVVAPGSPAVDFRTAEPGTISAYAWLLSIIEPSRAVAVASKPCPVIAAKCAGSRTSVLPEALVSRCISTRSINDWSGPPANATLGFEMVSTRAATNASAVEPRACAFVVFILSSNWIWDDSLEFWYSLTRFQEASFLKFNLLLLLVTHSKYLVI